MAEQDETAKSADPPDSDCVVPGAPVPAEQLARYSPVRDPHLERDVANYVEGQAHDEMVQHVEKVKSEYVLGTEYEMWDVTTDKGRWWVVDGGLMNLYPQAHFQSLDYTLSFHIGLMSRMQSRSSKDREAELAPFDEVDRRMQQADDELERAVEAEDFQAVCMLLRESLISLIGAVRRRVDSSSMQVESPKNADFVGWSDVLVSRLCAGQSNKILRQYLKHTAEKTWQLVNAVTHDRRAADTTAMISLGACRLLFGTSRSWCCANEQTIYRHAPNVRRAVSAPTLTSISRPMATTTIRAASVTGAVTPANRSNGCEGYTSCPRRKESRV